jgi:hypothetical protein
MNERIEKLAKQATVHGNTEHHLDIPSWYLEKFAELIVRECADLFDKNETEYAIPEHRIHNSIMIHFGLY